MPEGSGDAPSTKPPEIPPPPIVKGDVPSLPPMAGISVADAPKGDAPNLPTTDGVKYQIAEKQFVPEKGPTVPDQIPDRPQDKADPGQPMEESSSAKHEPKVAHAGKEKKETPEHAEQVETAKKTGEVVASTIEGAAGAAEGVQKAGGMLSDAMEALHMEKAAVSIGKAAKSLEHHLEKVSKLAESKAGKMLGETAAGVATIAEGVKAFGESKELGTSTTASLISAVAQGVVGTADKGMEAIDKIVDPAQSAVEKVFGAKVAEYTAVIANNTPLKTSKNLVAASVDIVDGLARHQNERVVDNLETGKYGDALGGYALSSDAFKSMATGDATRVAHLSDRAAAGELGVPARTGDRIGDWAGKHATLPQSILHLLPF